MTTNAVNLPGWDSEFNGLVLDTESKGKLVSDQNLVTVYGAAYRDNGVMVMPGTLSTNTGDDVYVKWSPNGKSLHARFFALLVPSDGTSTAIEVISEGFDAMAFTTHHSYLNSTVVNDDVSYFTRMHFDPIKKNITYTTAAYNYDNQGGSVIQTKTIAYNTTSKYDTALWDSYKNNGLGFGFGVFDNYAGTSASVTLHEVITKSNSDIIESTNQNLFDAAVNLAARAYSDTHLADPAKISIVNQLTSGWSPIQASDLGMTASLAESFSIIDGNLLRYSNGGFSASVGVTILEGVRTLGISFEGTNTSFSLNTLNDLASDLVGIDLAYLQGRSFAAQVAKYAADNKFDQVLVSGHSLGGAMAQLFMSEFGIQDTRYIGMTFGNPGVIISDQLPSDRFVNFLNTHDPVPKAGALRLYGTSGSVVEIQTEDAGGLLSINNHSIFELSPTQVSYNNAINYLGTQFQRELFHNLTVGTQYHDSISVSGDSEGIYGLDGFDKLQGNNLENLFIGGSGGDYIDGGDNVDTSKYSAPRDSYSLKKYAFGWEVRSISASDGTDTLVSVERLQFFDKKVALDIDGNAGKVAKILASVFGAAAVSNAEYVGIGLELLDGGMSYETLAALAINAAGAKTREAVVDLLWTNLMGSSPTVEQAKPYVDSLAEDLSNVGSLGANAADVAAIIGVVNLDALNQTGMEFI